jgi:F-type H+-transporting ATPase subunit beta
VPLAITLNGCERILNDELSDRPEGDFYMIGSLDDVGGEAAA